MSDALAALVRDAIQQKAAERGGKYTYRQIAEDMGGGRHFSHIQKIATGTYKRPDPTVIRELAQVLHPYLDEQEALRAAGWATEPTWSPPSETHYQQYWLLIDELWADTRFQAMVENVVRERTERAFAQTLRRWADTFLQMEIESADTRVRGAERLSAFLRRSGDHQEASR